MTQLTGNGAIPEPIEGYKLVITDVEYFISPNKNVWVNLNFDRCHCPTDILSDDIEWKLEPILDSGVWVKGMPLPKPKEGTLLLAVFGESIFAAYSSELNTVWCMNGIDRPRWLEGKFLTQVVAWQWISAPKNN